MIEEYNEITPLNLGVGFDEVFTPLPAWELMERKRVICRDLYNGVDSLREKGQVYLPKKDMEQDIVYEKRLCNAVLFNSFKHAVGGLVGRVFSKQVDVTDGPENFLNWYEDIDLIGDNIDMFTMDVFRTAIIEGVSFILVDYPPKKVFENREEQIKFGSNYRPYWTHIKPNEVIGWRIGLNNGIPVVEHIRIKQTIEVPDGEYGVKLIERVRIYEPGSCKEYTRDNNQKDPEVFFAEYKMDIDRIPIVPIFTNRTGIMTASPPLYDLAVLNIRHYQSNSTQDHILDYSRFPLLFGINVVQQTGQEVPFGPSNMIHTTNADAKLSYIEHTGKAIEAGSKSLEKLEEQMALLSHEPLLMKRSGNETATRTAITSAAASSVLQSWAFQLKDAIEQCLVMTALWEGVDPEKAGVVQINTDYALTISNSDYNNLSKLREDGELSRTTLWNELRRRGFLGPDFNSEDESKLLHTEGAVQDNGNGLLLKMVEKEILPKELLFRVLKSRGDVDPDLDWKDVLEMIQRESVGPTVGFNGMNTLNQMIGA